MKQQRNINVTRSEAELLLWITERHITGCETIFMMSPIREPESLKRMETKIKKLEIIKKKIEKLLEQ